MNTSTVRRRLVVLALFLAPASAFAYIDPGSGLLVWQGLLAAVGAVIVFLRNPLDIIKRVLRRLRKLE